MNQKEKKMSNLDNVVSGACGTTDPAPACGTACGSADPKAAPACGSADPAPAAPCCAALAAGDQPGSSAHPVMRGQAGPIDRTAAGPHVDSDGNHPVIPVERPDHEPANLS